MAQLSAYSGPGQQGRNQCPKCRGIDISAEYRASLIRISQHAGSLVEITQNGDPTECLIRQCRRCDYGWVEACADAPPADPEN